MVNSHENLMELVKIIDTRTIKTNCPFKLFACYYKTNGHPFVRQLTQNGRKLRMSNVPQRDILSTNKVQTNEHFGRNEMKFRRSFCVHPISLKIWCAFPQVGMMDATYMTNKRQFVFCLFVCITSTNTTFSIGFKFMGQEKESIFIWALNYLKVILDVYGKPCVIVTGREITLMNACTKVFLSAIQLRCR
uniref:MULE transposase domain-containing protein n=1 Tax=Lactuca sativa TaxID=4236 RepID=A0A9R1WK45_LACSA|nr:hypothetical protein LSAT_V11C200063490 [Lactuca sativa]